jgi:hypothetical protein
MNLSHIDSEDEEGDQQVFDWGHEEGDESGVHTEEHGGHGEEECAPSEKNESDDETGDF